MGFDGVGAQRHLSPAAPKGGSLPSGAVHHSPGKPAPTRWDLCTHPGTKTPVPGDAGAPSTAEKAASASACGEQTAFTGTAQSMACRYPVSPGSGSPREDSSCRLHCKIMRGQLFGYSWDKQLLLQLPQTFTAKPVPRRAPFASSTPQLHRSRRGGPAAGKAAMWGLPVDFPLSFLHMESHQLTQRTPGTSSTCCGAQLPCSCYTDAGKTIAPDPLSKSSCCRDSSVVTETPQERSCAQGDSTAADSLFLPQLMK